MYDLGQSSSAHFLIRRCPPLYGRYRRLLEEAEQWGLADRRAWRARQLERQFHWAARLPGYRGRDFTQPLREQPPLTKRSLQEAPSRFRRKVWPPARHAVTSGSTGAPIGLARSFPSVVFEQATLDWLAAKAGIDLATGRVAVLRGNQFKAPDDLEPPFWRAASRNRLVFSSNHLGPSTYRHFRDALVAFAPDILIAYPSSAELLLTLAEGDPKRPRFRLAICSSETARPDLRARLRAVFGAALLDYYGLAERVSIAYSLADGEYRFVCAYGCTELVELEGGRRSIVGTGYWNRAQPLIRYETGDFAELPDDVREDDIERIELGLAPFRGVVGRVSDYLEKPDGSRVYAMHHVPLRVDGVLSVQFLQKSFNSVLAIVVPSPRFSTATLDQLRRNFYSEAPSSFDLRFEISPSPRRLPSGKVPLVIRPEIGV